MVTQCHRPEERNKVQSFNDFLIFGTMAVGSFASGTVAGHARLGGGQRRGVPGGPDCRRCCWPGLPCGGQLSQRGRLDQDPLNTRKSASPSVASVHAFLAYPRTFRPGEAPLAAILDAPGAGGSVCPALPFQSIEDLSMTALG